eukprot:tig00020904_g15177.t1
MTETAVDLSGPDAIADHVSGHGGSAESRFESRLLGLLRKGLHSLSLGPDDVSAGANLDRQNVFVKYLPSELTDQGLYQLFSPFGGIVSAKVMVDHQTGNSLGYGFVRYQSPEEAQNAIAQMNGMRIGNKTLLCKLSNSSPASSNTPGSPSAEPSNNLYIKPLQTSTTEADLRKMFQAFGEIVDVKVMVDRQTGVSRQIGFVRFERVEDATKAALQMNGLKLDNNAPPLVVKYAESDDQKRMRRAKQQQRQELVASRKSGLSTGSSPTPFAYVPPAPPGVPPLYMDGGAAIMPSPLYPSLLSSVPYMGSSDLFGNALYATGASNASAFSSNISADASNLFVFHLPSEVDDARLAALFAPFGHIDSVKVITDKVTGESKGYGFVKFSRLEDAMRSVASMNGFKLGNKHLKVSFKTAGPGLR